MYRQKPSAEQSLCSWLPAVCSYPASHSQAHGHLCFNSPEKKNKTTKTFGRSRNKATHSQSQHTQLWIRVVVRSPFCEAKYKLATTIPPRRAGTRPRICAADARSFMQEDKCTLHLKWQDTSHQMEPFQADRETQPSRTQRCWAF